MSQIEFISRSCPICASDETYLLKRSPENPLNLTFTEYADIWRGFRKDNIHFDYYQCRSCALIYCRNYFGPETLELLYSRMDDNLRGAAEAQTEATQRQYVSPLRRFCEPEGRWVDIGADVGQAASALSEFGVTVDAIEPNRDVWEQLQFTIGEGQIFPDLEQLILGDHIYNGALMIHVLDHLIDPKKYLEILSTHLEAESCVTAVVHNYASFLRRVLRNAWPPFCLQHPQIFTPRTLRILFEESGFQQVEILKTRNSMALNDLCSDALATIGWKNLAGVIRRRETRAHLNIPLGNIQILATSKK